MADGTPDINGYMEAAQRFIERAQDQANAGMPAQASANVDGAIHSLENALRRARDMRATLGKRVRDGD